MLTMQFPCCPSSATMDNRILPHGCMWTAAMSKDVKLRCSKAWSGKSTRGWRPSTQPTAKHLLERKCWKSSNGAAMLWEIWLHHFKKDSCFGFWTCFCLSQPKKKDIPFHREPCATRTWRISNTWPLGSGFQPVLLPGKVFESRFTYWRVCLLLWHSGGNTIWFGFPSVHVWPSTYFG